MRDDGVADSLQFGQAGGGEGTPGGDPRESIQLRPGVWRPYTDWALPISWSRTSLFPFLEIPVLTLLGASDSEKEKDLDIFGRGGSVKMLPSPLYCNEKDKNRSAMVNYAITRLVVFAMKIFICF